MAEQIIKFLDLEGLKTYDVKIKAYLESRIASVGHLKRTVVDALPEVSQADIDTIYMVKRSDDKKGQNASDAYNEYIIIESGDARSFEMIGNTEVSFDGYSTTEQMNSAISAATVEAKSHADELNTTMSGRVDTLESFKNRTEGFATSAQGALADNSVQKESGKRLMTDAEGTAIANLANNYDTKGSAATAKSEAIAAAATDATTKADTAESNAKSYADGLKATVDKTIEDNEKVTAAALANLDERINTLSGKLILVEESDIIKLFQ